MRKKELQLLGRGAVSPSKLWVGTSIKIQLSYSYMANNLWHNIQMVNLRGTHRTTGGMTLIFSLLKAYLELWLYYMGDLFCVLHKSSEPQLPRRMEIRYGGPVSRTGKPFKGDYLMSSFYIAISSFLLFLMMTDPPSTHVSLLPPSPALWRADKAAGRKQCNKRKR